MARISKAWLDAQEELETFKSEFESKYGFLLTVYISHNKVTQIPCIGLDELLEESNQLLMERNPSGYINASFGKVKINNGIKTKTRAREIVTIRQIFCYIARELGYTTVGIARFLGKDHATIIYSSNSVKDFMETNYIPVVEVYTVLKNQLIVKYGTYRGSEEQESDSEGSIV